MRYPIDNRRPCDIAEEIASIKDAFTPMRLSLAEKLGGGDGFGWNDKWMITKAIEALIDAKLEAFSDRIQDATNVRP